MFLSKLRKVRGGYDHVVEYTTRNLLSLRERGLLADIFPDNPSKLTDLCNARPQVVYGGFDPTAESLHVGNLAVLMLLLHAQRAGHSVIALIGGATASIGDPSGKNSERPELDKNTINANSPTIVNSIKSIFTNHEKLFWDNKAGAEPLKPLVTLNNLDWYTSVSALDLIGSVGRHFRLGQMLSRTAVAARLGKDLPISYTEFSYQVFQAYDWLHLNQKYGCRIQVGGNDQMGNFVAGQDLVSRARGEQVYGLTVPLVTSETGNKYGKTAGNAVWLNEEQTSPFQLYQFLVRTKDSEVKKFLQIFTFLTTDEIEAVMRKHTASPENRSAQKELGKHVTRLVHGDSGYSRALEATGALYSENIEALSKLSPSDISAVFQTVGNEIRLQPGTTILDMAVEGGCFQTKSDAMRIIEAGGFFINYQRVGNFEEVIVPGIHILPNSITLARVGKKNYHLIKWRL